MALLVGNADYALNSLDLDNPLNDVNALESKLQLLGFEVRALRDVNHIAMNDALNWFGTQSRGADIALFFYAGHGVQLGGENYFIGTGLKGFEPEQLVRSSIDLSRIKTTLRDSQAKISIIILDACRNNPFLDRDWAIDGLAQTGGGPGMLIAYATDPGNVAYDGLGHNSVFTTALLENLAEENLDVRLMFGRVRQQVVRVTGGAQIPWVEESVLGEHYFARTADQTSIAAADEVAAWRDIASSRQREDFERYLDIFPNGLFAAIAEDRIAQLSRPGGPITFTGAQSTGEMLAEADLTRVSAALDRLGFLDRARGLAIVDTDLGRAFDAYRAASPNPERSNIESLLQDAARLTIFLAASTGQRIRTDFAALTSIEKTLDVALDTFRQLQDVAGDAAEYKPLIDEAAADIKAIYLSRQAVQQRLDESRTFYDDLLISASDNYPQEVEGTVLSGAQAGRTLVNAPDQVLVDAKVFIRHVRDMKNRARGSYAWITDFLKKS